MFHQKRPLIKYAIITATLLSCNAQAELLNAYIGTYAPNGEGVYLTQVDSQTGVMSEPKLAAKVANGAQLIYNPNTQTLYVASEVNNYQNTGNGSIISYRVAKNGELTEINQVNSEGAGPVFLSIHPSGLFLLSANYINGIVAVFPIDEQGELKPAVSIKQGEGEPGLNYPVAAVKGSFAVSDHDGTHAHTINSDPSGKFAFSTDLGLDKIYQWKIDKQGTLTPNDPAFIAASSSGAGPRHFVFHPTRNMLYLINEESSTLTTYGFDSDKGTLQERSSLSSLPDNYQGTSYASGIIISQDGNNLYVANRLHNSISQFTIDDNGLLTLVDNIWARGDYPRTLSFSPDDKFIYVMNQRSDNITRFAVDPKSGKLNFIDDYIAVGSPSQMVFAK